MLVPPHPLAPAPWKTRLSPETDKTHRGTTKNKPTKNVHYGGDLCFPRFFVSQNLHQRFEVEYLLPKLFWGLKVWFLTKRSSKWRYANDSVLMQCAASPDWPGRMQCSKYLGLWSWPGWLPNITWTQVKTLNIPPYPSIILEISHSWHVLSWRCQHRNQTCQILAPRSMDSVVLGGCWVRCFHSWCSRAPGTAQNRQQICDFVTPCMGGVEP